MIKQAHWKKRLAVVLSGGFLVLNTAVVLAAPVELSLEDSIMLALQNNPAIKIADADREKAEWSISEAKGLKMPTLSVNHTDFRSKYSASNISDKFSFILILNITMPSMMRVLAPKLPYLRGEN